MTEVSRECWDEIQRELREGTPDTPERIAIFKMADEIYARTAVRDAIQLLTARGYLVTPPDEAR